MWAQVINNTVAMIVTTLPQRFQGTSGFPDLTREQLRSYGWYPFSQSIPQFDPETHYTKTTGYQITATEVIEVFDVHLRAPVTKPIRVAMSLPVFRERFTTDELLAIETARRTHASEATRSVISVAMDNINNSAIVDPTNARIIWSINQLNLSGLLTRARAAQILATT